MIGRGNCEKADDWLGREPGQASGGGAGGGGRNSHVASFESCIFEMGSQISEIIYSALALSRF